MSHYFTDNSNLEHDYKTIEYFINDEKFIFKTDKGVFSRENVDKGTDILLNILIKEKINGSVLDVGTGYGVIAIVIKRFFTKTDVVGIDINPRAVELALSNALNANSDIKFLVSDRFKNIKENYDNIIINPPIRSGKSNIYSMFKESYEHLNKNGSLWIVIRKKQGSKSAFMEIKKIFNNCDVVKSKKGYEILKSVKY